LFCGNTIGVEEYNLPVTLICPICKEVKTYAKFIRRKTDKPVIDLPLMILAEDVAISRDIRYVDKVHTQINSITEKIRDVMTSFDMLDKLSEKAKNQLSSELGEKVGEYVHLGPAFSRRGFVNFMSEHVIAFDLNKSFGCRTMIAIVPAFVKYSYGFCLYETKGYRVYAVNQYSMLTYPVHKAFLDRHNFDYGNIELSLTGSKLYGEDLAQYWDKLDFVVEDRDHTQEYPSVFVINKAAAFRWLIEKGIPPTRTFGVRFPDWVNENGELVSEYHGLSEAQSVWMKSLKENGRVICTGGSGIDEFKLFAQFISKRMGTLCLFITEREEIKVAATNSIVLTSGTFGEVLNQEDYLEYRIIAIDIDTWTGEDFDYLVNCGRIIIAYTENPLIDCLEGNHIAPLIYGLCPIVAEAKHSVDTAKKIIENVNFIVGSSMLDILTEKNS